MLRSLFVSFVSVCVVAASLIAQSAGPIPVSVGTTFELIATWEPARIDAITSKELAAFTKSDAVFAKAKYPVRLYKVVYPSVIPEKANRPTMASGLVAVPDSGAAAMPVVSYQHGTVFGRTEVPSVPEDSMETRLAIAQFASRGFVVIGADYFGLGSSPEKDGYVVKGSQQQACLDMYFASLAVLKQLKIAPKEFFLSGWSQGGWVTAAFLEKLESLRIPVAAAATASAPLDTFAGLNALLFSPRPEDAVWKTTIFILSAFSYEEYYGVDGMTGALFRPEVHEVVRRFYMKEAVDFTKIPTTFDALIRKEWLEPTAFAGSAYARLLMQNQSFRWGFRTPVRMHYGEADEIVRPDLAVLGASYNRALGGTTVEASSMGATNHRGTYVASLLLQGPWFETFVKP